MLVSWKLTYTEEFVLMPLVVQVLNHRSKKNVFTNEKIRTVLSEFGHEIKDSQIRKIVFNIRQRGLIPLLIADNEGYYMATSIEQVRNWIATHSSKMKAMASTLHSMEQQFEQERQKLKEGNSELSGQMNIFDIID